MAATNKDIEKAVDARLFREDLFYRLNVFPITIPPLRERRDDIPPLAQHFLNKYSAEVRKGPLTISDEAMDILMKSPWKGNVRELENVIERAVIYAEGGVIRAQDLGISESSILDALAEHVPMDGPLQEVAAAATRIAESRRIRQVLKQTGREQDPRRRDPAGELQDASHEDQGLSAGGERMKPPEIRFLRSSPVCYKLG